MHTHAHMWRPEVNTKHLRQSLSTSFFEAGSLAHPEVHCHESVSSPLLRLQVHPTALGFCMQVLGDLTRVHILACEHFTNGAIYPDLYGVFFFYLAAGSRGINEPGS